MITIIILLILAVVAIRAVQGDGIISKAKEAKSATTEAQEEEQIQLAINEWNIQKNYPTNTEPNFESFMREKFSDIIANDDGSLTITMPDTNNEYKVKEDGTITELADNGGGSNPTQIEDLDYIETYFMGTKDVKGERPKNIKFQTLITAPSTMTFSDTNIKFGGIPDQYLTEMYVRYNTRPYKIVFDGSTMYTTSVRPVETKGREGKYVSYDNKIWIILYDDTNGIQMISVEGLKYNGSDFNLGYNDSSINWDSLTENL